ncbi:hypothetical protein GCM10018790_64690 [Kitasatospora xanthocidica]|uniref:DUF5959 family protein n=1 Tax=Kitasatospora xanthocidica TaxID=83382 RepID=UPI00167AE384|nr:DUF5959 family protein [Kitasatospora xanthocidica]GHF77628.1 hypothetical protein GCM10018790_64690 [Kitasatospora xanthocidica]
MEDDFRDLIHLADPPGTSGHAVSLRVLKRVPRSGFLDCEFVVETETISGSFPVGITSDDLDDWEEALDRLADDLFVSWLNSGRSVELGIKPLRSGAIGVSIHDAPSSQVTVSLPLSPPAGWVEDHRARLESVRRVLTG